jgi:hypothetical protein
VASKVLLADEGDTGTSATSISETVRVRDAKTLCMA